MEGVTSGLRVVELADDSIAVSYCGKLFADYGADVLKIELPGGDSLRHHGPFAPSAEWEEAGGLFAFLNTSKQSVTIDWQTADGAALVHRLLEGVDILIHDLGAEDREALGLPGDHATLVEVAITPCGLTGPYADQQHVPLTMAALGGWTYPMGDPGLPPLYPGGPYISYLAGISAATGALAAIEERVTSGLGQLVEASEFETAIGTIPFDTLHLSYAGTHRVRTGDLYGDNPLAPIYPCADGYVQFQVGFRPFDFLRILGGDELAADPRFQNADLRSQNRQALATLILDWLKDKKRWELFEICARNRLVFAAVPDVSEVLELQPHRERNFYVDHEGDAFAGLRFPGPAIRFGDGGWHTEEAPAIGAQNPSTLAPFTGAAGPALRDARVI